MRQLVLALALILAAAPAQNLLEAKTKAPRVKKSKTKVPKARKAPKTPKQKRVNNTAN